MKPGDSHSLVKGDQGFFIRHDAMTGAQFLRFHGNVSPSSMIWPVFSKDIFKMTASKDERRCGLNVHSGTTVPGGGRHVKEFFAGPRRSGVNETSMSC
jgi:hypothetical protein